MNTPQTSFLAADSIWSTNSKTNIALQVSFHCVNNILCPNAYWEGLLGGERSDIAMAMKAASHEQEHSLVREEWSSVSKRMMSSRFNTSNFKWLFRQGFPNM